MKQHRIAAAGLALLLLVAPALAQDKIKKVGNFFKNIYLSKCIRLE
jgi:K+-transporting ATPase A subunit